MEGAIAENAIVIQPFVLMEVYAGPRLEMTPAIQGQRDG